MNRIFRFGIAVLLSLGMLATTFSPISAQHKKPLKFGANGSFKIAQFTDIHWDNKSAKCAETIKTIEAVLATEKPNLAILTGDVVTAPPAREGWLTIAKLFGDAKIPWAVTLGNHDSEHGISRNQIFDLIGTLPYFVGSKGPQIGGCGNYALPIVSSKGKSVEAVIYCIDSNDYAKNKNDSYYDWIQFNQINWYRQTSDHYTAANNQSPVPSLIFFHIPLIEHNDAWGKETSLGTKKENVSSAQINSGMFASMVEKKDVMGVFVGHDHENNYIGIDHDIALAFGQVTGSDAYGKFERGARIIELREGEFSFDTWIRTPSGIQLNYNYPSGIGADSSPTDFLQATMTQGTKHGIKFKYYEGYFKSTAKIAQAQEKKSGVLKNISLSPATARDSFAFEFSGWIKIPKKAVYRFYTYSDDGSKLFIDGREVVDNDGSHSARRAEGKIALDEGLHEFKLLYFENYMGEELEVGISSIGLRECKIPDDFFFIE